jgi:hypothetical protein
MGICFEDSQAVVSFVDYQRACRGGKGGCQGLLI